MKIAEDGLWKQFAWGVSTAAYQIEGAHVKHGKGLSIWDDFTQRKGRIFKGQNGNIACDYYQHYHQDLALMGALSIPNYRFSISWSRIFPEGTGAINKPGVEFYNRVIDFCLELDIQPWITLYHWDLPLDLEKKGGWANRDIIGWFEEYVSFCIRTFGDRVKYWMVLNEPMVFTGAGYFLGVHAPGRRGLNNFLAALHHAAICQAEGGRIIRSLNSNLKIGTTFSCSHVDPASDTDSDQYAAIRIDALLNKTFIEPLLGMGYPAGDLKILQRVEQYVKDGDEAKLAFDMDFIGLQNYTREIVAHSFFTPFVQARIIHAGKRKVERTLMNWEVYPESIYLMLKKYGAYRNIKSLIVTENGAAFDDVVEDGVVNDISRQIFLQDHITQVLRAKEEGVNVNGYFVWTFTDNFEWAEGFHPRFGLVYVDFLTQRRIVKSSGFWYSRFITEQRRQNYFAKATF
ncbi:MAG: beta-glucosidase [Chitinophagaceae bacterium]|nr:beta-glucosidase [Chitinophagaceae bacterium]